MKIKNIAINSLLYALYMFGSSFIVMLVESLFVYIITRFYLPPFSVLTIIRAVIYTAGVIAILGGIGYFEGYREGRAAVGETIGGGALAILIHFLFAMLFHFQAFVSGGVRFVAGLIRHGMAITPDTLDKETSILLFILVFLLYGAFYVGLLAVTRFFGAQKRIIRRADLRRGETDADEA